MLGRNQFAIHGTPQIQGRRVPPAAIEGLMAESFRSTCPFNVRNPHNLTERVWPNKQKEPNVMSYFGTQSRGNCPFFPCALHKAGGKHGAGTTCPTFLTWVTPSTSGVKTGTGIVHNISTRLIQNRSFNCNVQDIQQSQEQARTLQTAMRNNEELQWHSDSFSRKISEKRTRNIAKRRLLVNPYGPEFQTEFCCFHKGKMT